MAYGLLGSVVLVFIAACRCQFDGKYGGRFLTKKFRKIPYGEKYTLSKKAKQIHYCM